MASEWRTEERIKKLGAHCLLLKQPHWYKLVGLDRRSQDDHAIAEMSPEGQKVAARKARKSFRKQARHEIHPSLADALKAA